MAEKYQGFQTVQLNNEDMAKFYSGELTIPALENEYLIIKNEEGEVVDKLCFQDGRFRPTQGFNIQNKWNGVIKPRNIYQSLAIDLLKDDSIGIKVLTGVYGSAKAQPIDTIIPTPNGMRKMDDIKVGDYIFDRDGQATRVLGVFPQGIIDCYKITMSDGRETYCGEEHLWSYYTSKGNLITKTTKEMFTDGVRKPSGGYRYRLPLNKALQFEEKEYDIDPYVMGVFLGDGCCLEKPLTLSSSDEELVAEVARLIHSPCYIKNPANNYNWTFRLPEQQGCIKNFQTTDFFENYPEVMTYALNKHIPNDYFFGSPTQRLSLLQGLLDTDGAISIDKGRISFCSTSRQLVNDVKRLVYELGYSCSERKADIRDEHKNPVFSISISVPNEVKPELFRLSRKKARANKNLQEREITHSTTLTIHNIEKMTEQKEMVCFLVDNPDHLYLTNDCIVTHNTFLMLNMALEKLDHGEFDKIIFVRNGLSPQGVPDIGALPGTALDKTIVWGYCIADHIGGEDGLQMMINSNTLEIIPLNYIRGRDLKRSIIFSDEAENLTVKLIQLLIGRVGDGSQLWIAGDYRQTDLGKKFSEGLSTMIEKLKGQRLFGIVDMPKTERSAIAELSNLLDA